MNDVSESPVSRTETTLSVIARWCGRLLLVLVAVQFAIVLARYLLAVNFLWFQELAIYFHATIFMLAAAWALLCNKHVRIDVISSHLAETGRRRVELWGTLFLLIPMMLAIIVTSVPYVLQSWSILEGSTEVSGLPGLFLLKSVLPVFALLMLIAGVMRLRQLYGR